MARPQARKTTTPTRGNRRDDLSSLSTEVLRLRLQALSLPIAGNRATLLASLRRALDGRSATNAAPAGRIDKRQRRGARRQPKAVRVNANVSNANAPPVQSSRDNLAAGETEAESEDALSDAGSLPDDLFEDQTQPAVRSNAFSEAQMSVLRETVQSSIQAALLQQRSHPQHFGLPSLATAVPSCRAPGVATLLGLNRGFRMPTPVKLPLSPHLQSMLLFQSRLPHLPLTLDRWWCQECRQQRPQQEMKVPFCVLQMMWIAYNWNSLMILTVIMLIP